MATEPNNQSSTGYRPFSNGTEFDLWSARNCNMCRYGATTDETPHCAGEHGLVLALFNDGLVPVMALDFIGTTQREVDENGAFCTLKRDCHSYEAHLDEDEDLPEENLKDAEIKEVVAEAFEKHGYRLPELMRTRILQNYL